MKIYLNVIVLGLMATWCALADEGGKPVDQVPTVRGKIEALVKLLENGNDKKFLEAAVNPVEKKEKEIVIDEAFIKRFKKRKSKKMLILLKGLIGKEATSITETTVSYEVKGGKYMNFKLHEGQWYLSNGDDKPAK